MLLLKTMDLNSRTHWTLLALAKRDAGGIEQSTSRDLYEAYHDYFQSPTDASAACAVLFEDGYASHPETWDDSTGYAYSLTEEGVATLYAAGEPTTLRGEAVPTGVDVSLPPRDSLAVETEVTPSEPDSKLSGRQSDGSGDDSDAGNLYAQKPSVTKPGSKRHAYRERGRVVERVCNVNSPPGQTAWREDVHDISQREYGRLSNRCTWCCNKLGVETPRSQSPAAPVDIDVGTLMETEQQKRDDASTPGHTWTEPSNNARDSDDVSAGFSVSSSSDGKTWYTSDDPDDNRLYKRGDDGEMEPATISLEPDWMWLGVQLAKLEMWSWAARAFNKQMSRPEAFTAEDIVYRAAWDSTADLDFGSPVDGGVSLTLAPTPVAVEDVPERFRDAPAVVEQSG
jgi:hypothetical protein